MVTVISYADHLSVERVLDRDARRFARATRDESRAVGDDLLARHEFERGSKFRRWTRRRYNGRARPSWRHFLDRRGGLVTVGRLRHQDAGKMELDIGLRKGSRRVKEHDSEHQSERKRRFAALLTSEKVLERGRCRAYVAPSPRITVQERRSLG